MSLPDRGSINARLMRWHVEHRLLESCPTLTGIPGRLSPHSMQAEFPLDWEQAGIVLKALAKATEAELNDARRAPASHHALYQIAHAFQYAELYQRITRQFENAASALTNQTPEGSDG